MSSSETLSAADVQRMLTEGVRAYAAAREAGEAATPFDGEMTATEVLITVADMLEAVDVEVFELGLWNVFGIEPEGGRDGDRD